MKKASIVVILLIVGVFCCGFTRAPEVKYFTLYYNTQKIVVNDKTLKPSWFNTESHSDFTDGKSIYERAEGVSSDRDSLRSALGSLAMTFPEIQKILKKIEREINLPAFDGNVNFISSNLDCFIPRNDAPGGGRFWITNARSGVAMDIEAASREILDALTCKTYADIIIKTKEIPHKTAKEMLSKLGLRASYSTRFDAGNENRSSNIARSAECFDGYILLPGETLSYNRTVGPRTAERGYEEAKIIIDGEFVPGVGGGVCQTSTTLFNAALLAGLTVVKSQNHSLPISYVPLGRDAMVSSAVDLVLRNDTGAPVYFEAGIEHGNRVSFKIYGNKLGTFRYKFTTEVTEKAQEYETIGAVPPSLEGYRKVVIEDGYPARFTKTFLETYSGGKLASRKLVRHSRYKGKIETIKYEKIPEEISIEICL